MSRKILIVGDSVAIKVRDLLDKEGAWDDFDVVVVPNDRFDEALSTLRADLPPGKILRDAVMKDFGESIQDVALEDDASKETE